MCAEGERIIGFSGLPRAPHCSRPKFAPRPHNLVGHHHEFDTRCGKINFTLFLVSSRPIHQLSHCLSFFLTPSATISHDPRFWIFLILSSKIFRGNGTNSNLTFSPTTNLVFFLLYFFLFFLSCYPIYTRPLRMLISFCFHLWEPSFKTINVNT